MSCTLGAGVSDPPGPDEPPYEFQHTGYRSSGPWGYMGLAEARSHLIIADGRWASCSERLFDDASQLRAR